MPSPPPFLAYGGAFFVLAPVLNVLPPPLPPPPHVSTLLCRQGGEPEIDVCARTLINDWQRGKLPFFVPPPASADDEGKSPRERKVKAAKPEKDGAVAMSSEQGARQRLKRAAAGVVDAVLGAEGDAPAGAGSGAGAPVPAVAGTKGPKANLKKRGRDEEEEEEEGSDDDDDEDEDEAGEEGEDGWNQFDVGE